MTREKLIERAAIAMMTDAWKFNAAQVEQQRKENRPAWDLAIKNATAVIDAFLEEGLISCG